MLALVVGGGPTVRSEIGRVAELCKVDTFVVVNDIGTLWNGRIDHWVTLHPEKMTTWIKQRKENGYPEANCYWTERGHEYLLKHKDIPFQIEADYEPSGLSGLFATRIALRRLNADKIILVGCPMDRTGHVLGRKGHWINYHRRAAWTTNAGQLRDKVRSMSGWTKQLLGDPTAGWASQ